MHILIALLLLARKALRFREALLSRHLASEGVVLYRVNLDTLARDLESGNYPNLADTPTFTGQWAAASCTRVQVESDDETHREAVADA